VLESIPRELTTEITRELHIPTIGIGAGPDCDGQILVLHDMIGLGGDQPMKFVRRYANVGEIIAQAVGHYADDVRAGRFPADEESYHLPASAGAHASSVTTSGRRS
jgi:3-methyl-2-oxobutanoate hydroxymethyltransferase